jgi:hypothetical protein
MPVRRDPNTPEYNRPTEALSIEGPRLHEPLHLGRPTQALSRSVQPRPHTPQHRALELTLAPADMARRQWGAEARLWLKPAPAHMLRWRDTPYEETPQTKVTPTLKGLRTALVARSELIRPVVAICRNNCIARYNIARSIQRDPAGELPSLKVTIDLDMDNQIQRPLSWWSYMVRSVSLGERTSTESRYRYCQVMILRVALHPRHRLTPPRLPSRQPLAEPAQHLNEHRTIQVASRQTIGNALRPG